jgi:hypothetical protein
MSPRGKGSILCLQSQPLDQTLTYSKVFMHSDAYDVKFQRSSASAVNIGG